MLAARRLPEVLKSVLNDGVDGCCLMTEEGSILAAAFTEKSSMIDTSLAAISSSIWNNISKGASNTASIGFAAYHQLLFFDVNYEMYRLFGRFLAHPSTRIRKLRNHFCRQRLHSRNLRKECPTWIIKRSFRYLKCILHPNV